MKTREIEVLIYVFPNTLYAGTIIISNITTMRQLQRLFKVLEIEANLLEERKISIGAFFAGDVHY